MEVRLSVDPQSLFLPPCPIPRPGERIVFYQSALRVGGTLLGHSPLGKPVVRDDFDANTIVDSYQQIRRENPRSNFGPNWLRLPPNALVLKPSEAELRSFKRLLDQRTPPGPAYLDLVTEIWARGHEVYVVGGTVRDVLAKKNSKDVDLVTTMPLNLLFPIVQSMYRRNKKLEWEAQTNGHLRLGGALGTDDPFIDLCLFKHSKPGTEQAIFGDDFKRDIGHRDFACNSVYFDPISGVLIDPSGHGIGDSESHGLRIVCDYSLRSQFHKGQLVIRFFKFRCRGFQPAEGCAQEIAALIEPSLQSMTNEQRIGYTRSQLLSKCGKDEHAVRVQEFREILVAFGAEDAWKRYFEPYMKELINGK